MPKAERGGPGAESEQTRASWGGEGAGRRAGGEAGSQGEGRGPGGTVGVGRGGPWAEPGRPGMGGGSGEKGRGLKKRGGAAGGEEGKEPSRSPTLVDGIERARGENVGGEWKAPEALARPKRRV